MSDDEVRALAAEVKQQRVEINALKKIIGALIMQADLGGENVDPSTGVKTIEMKNGFKLYEHKGEINLLDGEDLSDAGFIEKDALLFRSKQPAFLLPEEFFDLFAREAVMINKSQNPSDNNAGY